MSTQRSTLIALVSVFAAGGCATVNTQKDGHTARAHCEKLETVDTRVQQSSPAHRPELAFHDHHDHHHHPPTAGASPRYVHGVSTYQLAHGDIHDAYVDPSLACYTRPRHSDDAQPKPEVPEPITSM